MRHEGWCDGKDDDCVGDGHDDSERDVCRAGAAAGRSTRWRGAGRRRCGQSQASHAGAAQREGAGYLQGELRHERGRFVIEVHREWAPLGADRFYNLVKNGFYDDIRFFRVLDGFMAQFGMHGDPAIQSAWGRANFNDDPVKQSNKKGYVTFAKSSAPNSRSTQVFINFVDNTGLDAQGFAPFGQVVEGMENVDKLYSGYGRQNVPDQGRITAEGNAYLAKEYPKLDYIKKATIAP